MKKECYNLLVNQIQNIMNKIARKDSMRYFDHLIGVINFADKHHLNANVTSRCNNVGNNKHKWMKKVVVNNVNGNTFTMEFVVTYNIPKNTQHIKILRWCENDKTLDNFTGFTSCDNSLGTRFCLSHSELFTNTPKTIYPFERENSRENLVTEKVFGIDDMGIGEEVYMPVRLTDRVRGEYTITLPTGTVIRVREGDIKNTCIRVIKRKVAKKR